jgi:hypothetical protein
MNAPYTPGNFPYSEKQLADVIKVLKSMHTDPLLSVVVSGMTLDEIQASIFWMDVALLGLKWHLENTAVLASQAARDQTFAPPPNILRS